MNWHFLKLKPPILRLVVSTLSLAAILSAESPLSVSVPNASQFLPLARSMTVKVLSLTDGWGSGTIIKQQGQIYTVLTNEHVLVAGDPPYRIQTPDGQIYPASVKLRAHSLGGNDLATVQFSSRGAVYAIAKLGATPAPEDEVFASGFPFTDESLLPSNPPLKKQGDASLLLLTENNGFALTTGKVSLVLDKALQGGYQLGYTNDIQKGMSGGPVLNRAGEVVAINGMQAYPLWGDPYVFQDGSEPTATVREQMIRLAFAIPMETINRNLENAMPRVRRRRLSPWAYGATPTRQKSLPMRVVAIGNDRLN